MSHVFSGVKSEQASGTNRSKNGKTIATVITYTSKNELVSFDVVNNPQSNQSAQEHITAEERTMMDMVMKSGS